MSSQPNPESLALLLHIVEAIRQQCLTHDEDTVHDLALQEEMDALSEIEATRGSDYTRRAAIHVGLDLAALVAQFIKTDIRVPDFPSPDPVWDEIASHALAARVLLASATAGYLADPMRSVTQMWEQATLSGWDAYTLIMGTAWLVSIAEAGEVAAQDDDGRWADEILSRYRTELIRPAD